MSKINKLLKARAAIIALAAGSVFSLTGCVEQEMAANEEYDVREQTGDEDGFDVGLKQEIEVPGQSFKLISEYTCDDSSKRQWRITSDKFLYFNVKTQGLPEGTEVYIDNVHIDTSIKSKYAVMDGIKQDSMDDHVHSSQLVGFPISDTMTYYGVNAIEGCNQEFIQGTFWGYQGYYSGDVTQERYTESDYLEWGVYANKIQIVYDLLVKGPNDKDFTNISVSTDFLVQVSGAEYNNEEIQKTK